MNFSSGPREGGPSVHALGTMNRIEDEDEKEDEGDAQSVFLLPVRWRGWLI